MNLSKSIKKTAGAAALSLTILLSSLALTPSTYAATPVAVGGKAIVSNTDGDTIRVREGAGTNYEQVAEVYEGQTVTVLAGPSKDGNGKVWYKVQGPGGTGWVSAGFLEGKEGAAAPVQPKAPAAPKLDGFAKVANTDGDPLRVRSAANTSGTVIATLDAGASVAIKAGPVTDKSGTSWYQVSANGTTGWVMSQYLAQAKAPVQPAAAPPAAAPAQRPVAAISGFAKVANTDGDPLRMRSSASRNASVITNLAPGTSVAVKQGPVDKDGVAWYQVSAGGTTGWVMGQYLAQAKSPVEPVVASKPAAPAPAPNVAPAQPAAPAAVAPAAEAPRTGTARGAEQPAAPAASSRADSIVNTAMKYVGYRYRFGGSSPSGFDCSGFVYYVMKSVGMPVARTIPGQIGSGSRVSSKDLQPGDLVFFSNTYKRGLSHAGIYIGNGKFVHAQNESTGVVVSNLWSSYWAAHYTTAVRPGR